MATGAIKAPLLAVMLLSLGGCQWTMDALQIEPKGAVTNTDSFCLVYEPIHWSVKDTDESIAEIKLNNAVFKRLCQHGSK